MIKQIIDQFTQKQYKNVCDIFESNKSVTLNPKIRYLISISYMFIESYDAALTEMLKLHKKRHELSDYNVYLSFIYLKNGDYLKSKNILTRKSGIKYSVLYFEILIE
jgi:hypothetical protein